MQQIQTCFQSFVYRIFIIVFSNNEGKDVLMIVKVFFRLSVLLPTSHFIYFLCLLFYAEETKNFHFLDSRPSLYSLLYEQLNTLYWEKQNGLKTKLSSR